MHGFRLTLSIALETTTNCIERASCYISGTPFMINLPEIRTHSLQQQSGAQSEAQAAAQSGAKSEAQAEAQP